MSATTGSDFNWFRKLTVYSGVSKKGTKVRYYGNKSERTAWRDLTRRTSILDDGQMFLSVEFRSYLETVDEILELTKEV